MKSMATRKSADLNVPLQECTEFCLHKSQQTIFAGIQSKIADYSEHRLVRYAKTVQDPQQKAELLKLIKMYREGHIALAWRRGRPIYVSVTKDS